MDLSPHIARFQANARAIAELTEAVSDAQARWKPSPDDWSIVEVICHLADEEREDFRARVDLTLNRPADPWTKIDPQGWITARAYNQRDLAAAVADFQAERERSIAWLRDLAAPDWERANQAPWGSIRAGDLLASWLAHDLLHLRQLVELHYAWTNRDLEPFETGYAGEW
jgi:hypothetical protein